MSTIPSVGSDTYSPGPNMVCSPEQEKVGTGSIEAIICPVYSDLRTRATVSKFTTFRPKPVAVASQDCCYFSGLDVMRPPERLRTLVHEVSVQVVAVSRTCQPVSRRV